MSAIRARGSAGFPGKRVRHRLLEPFRRLGADRVRGRGGVGLGLAIVRSIVGAHQGTLHTRPRPEGGLIVTVELPRQP